ncbi:MAG TPA: flavin reductase family protein [Burkholderiaceae bacterium]|nr:flavin reductase family protein [Burkholderiaceae bacterium]
MTAHASPSPDRAASDRHPAPDARHLRDCLGQFATGVTIVTTLDAASRPTGLTVNSFNALSLDPPLVLWSLSLRSASLSAFEACPNFAINVLAADQVALARRFARSGHDRFEGVATREGIGGVPLIDGAIAAFECELASHQRAGDHVLFIGRVRRCARESGGEPLLFWNGAFAHAASDRPG